MAAEAAIGAGISLIPYVGQQLSLFKSSVAKSYRVRARAKEYAQLVNWTSSPLRIATAMDWGQTCDLGEAVNRAANQVLRLGQKPRCWAFTSRFLMSETSGRNIEPAVWLRIIECLVNSEITERQSPLRHTRKPDGSAPLIPHGARIIREKLGENANPFKVALIDAWICANSKLLELEDSYMESHAQADIFNALYEPGSDNVAALDTIEREMRDAVDGAFGVAEFVIQLLEDIYHAFRGGGTLRRCHDGRQKHALRKKACKGLQLVGLAESSTPRVPGNLSFGPREWAKIQTQWVEFFSHWDAIVAKVSEAFTFPNQPGLDDLIFHDMATGYCASTSMLRKGAKCSSEEGSIIVHPAERGAVVSSKCTLIRLENSALLKNGIRREWKEPAVEFARYALLRCDLVDRSRMTFKNALEDWNKQHTFWDRAPIGGRLSLWTNTLSEDSGTTADDYRLVLIRQAIVGGSIEILAGRNGEWTVFGGFLSRETEGNLANVGNDKVLVVDRALNVHVMGFSCERGDSTFIRGPPPPEGIQGIHDTWGVEKGTGDDCQDGVFHKVLQRTGIPQVYRLMSGYGDDGFLELPRLPMRSKPQWKEPLMIM